MNPPVIKDAPGLKWQRNKYGWIARWRPRTDLVKAGFPLPSWRLWASTEKFPEPDPQTILLIVDRCQAMQAEMLAWAKGGAPTVPMPYEPTWAGLIREYKTDKDSPYHSKRFATRQHYDTLCRRLEKDCGADLIECTDARKLLRLHEGWTTPDKEGEPAKISMGHSMIGMMRTLTTFGSTLLKCPACKSIRSDLKDMRVKNGKPREEALTADQATLIRNRARADLSTRSIALAQAFQFDLALRQKDVIGEWVPLEEKGPLSTVINGEQKWIRGLRWEEIDTNLIVRHMTSKRQKMVVMDLHYCPMVLEELTFHYGSADRSAMPGSGPVIVWDNTGFPWSSDMFRKNWRILARACGIPDNVRNQDTRAGAATEADLAGVPLGSIKDMMTHSDIGMTQRYTRGGETKVHDAMKARAAHRTKAETDASERHANRMGHNEANPIEMPLRKSGAVD